jgi:hypothetical protein
VYSRLALVLIALNLQSCDLSQVPGGTCEALVSWEAPTQRTDGSDFTKEDISNFTLFINSEQSIDTITLERVIVIEDGYLVQWKVEYLTPGDHWFYMTVTDTEGNQSTFSNELVKNCTS